MEGATALTWADILVIGNGMVGHRFVEAAIGLRGSAPVRIVVVGEERHRAYDRVHLSSLFDGADAAGLALEPLDLDRHPDVEYVLGDPVDALDVDARIATTAS